MLITDFSLSSLATTHGSSQSRAPFPQTDHQSLSLWMSPGQLNFPTRVGQNSPPCVYLDDSVLGTASQCISGGWPAVGTSREFPFFLFFDRFPPSHLGMVTLFHFDLSVEDSIFRPPFPRNVLECSLSSTLFSPTEASLCPC